MADFIGNPWVVGIGASLISGLIVAILTRKIFTRRSDSEYSQSVSRANDEIRSAIIPLIAEQRLPDPIIVESLIHSTGRKYSVSSSDLYNPKSLAEDVIKEIVTSSFLSTQQKTEFCTQVAGIISAEVFGPSVRAANYESGAYQASRKRVTTMLSYYLSSMAAFASLLGFVTYFLTTRNATDVNITEGVFPIVLSTVGFATLLPIMSMFIHNLRLNAIRLKVGGFGFDSEPRPEEDVKESEEHRELNKTIDDTEQ